MPPTECSDRVDARRSYAVVYTPSFATGGVGAIAAMHSFLSDLTSNEKHLADQLTTERRVLGSYCSSR
jgi:hypothetical protein